jgi:hypothetical protein
MVATFGEGEGALVSGGGSIAANEVGAFDGTTGAGSGGRSSAALVSIVISFVSGCDTRSV